MAAKQKKVQQEEAYKRQVEERFQKKLADRDSQFSDNQHKIYQLENEEKLMVEKLNQTRQSYLSAQSGGPPGASSNGGMSPYKS